MMTVIYGGMGINMQNRQILVVLFFSMLSITVINANNLDRISKIRWVSCFLQGDETAFARNAQLSFGSFDFGIKEVVKTRYYYTSEYGGLRYPLFSFYLRTLEDEFCDSRSLHRKEKTLSFPSLQKVFMESRKVEADYDVYVELRDFDEFMLESGFHLMKYDAETGMLYSDGTYASLVDNGVKGNDRYPASYYSNDEFTLRLISSELMNEELLFESPFMRKLFVPVESILCIGERYLFSGDSLAIHTTPSVESSVEYISSRGSRAVEILEKTSDWEEINGQYSVWIKVRSKTGQEGWAWGRDIRFSEYDGYIHKDSTEFKRYQEYELVKYPLVWNKPIEQKNEKAIVISECNLLGGFRNKNIVLERLMPQDEILVIYEYKESWAGTGYFAFVLSDAGNNGWIELKNIQYEMDVNHLEQDNVKEKVPERNVSTESEHDFEINHSNSDVTEYYHKKYLLFFCLFLLGLVLLIVIGIGLKKYYHNL